MHKHLLSVGFFVISKEDHYDESVIATSLDAVYEGAAAADCATSIYSSRRAS
jgi:hypothetical protein